MAHSTRTSMARVKSLIPFCWSWSKLPGTGRLGSLGLYSVELEQWCESERESAVAQLCLTLCDPVDCSPPGSSVHGILQARIVERVAISFSRGSSWPRDRTQVSRIAGRCFNLWATREAHTMVLIGPKRGKFNLKSKWLLGLRKELKVERREKYLISQLPVVLFYPFSTKKPEQSFKNVYQPLSLMDLDEKILMNLGEKVFSKILTIGSVTAAAKLLQSCPTLCYPIDGSSTASPVPGILQARTLEWVAISFSNVGKWKVKVKLLSHVRLFTTPWTAAYQAPPSMGFSRQEYWSGVPLPSPSMGSQRVGPTELPHFTSLHEPL